MAFIENTARRHIRGGGSEVTVTSGLAFVENLRGQGNSLSTRQGQAEGGLHAPEKPAPPPTVGVRVNIDESDAQDGISMMMFKA